MNTLNSVFKIVIAYKDLITGIEAATVLRRLTAQLESEFELKNGAWQIGSGFWKFEMLRDPEFWRQVVAEAVAADMIIISVGDAELPASVRDWIESVLPMKEGGPAALVALLDRGSDAFGEPEAYLRRMAEQYGLDFFCNTEDQTRHIKSGIESIVSRSEGDSRIGRSFSPELRSAGRRQQRTQLANIN